MFKEKIIREMKEVFKEIPFGIEHTLKVLKNAEDIMKGENIEEEKELITIVAILHDIGAVEKHKEVWYNRRCLSRKRRTSSSERNIAKGRL
jgi:HD superfamily phosphodiesterase